MDKYIYFGSYPQSGNEKEPIKWQVLEENNGELLLLTDKIIDSKEFNTGKDNNYKTSDIRKWLNTNFYEAAFNTNEQSRIVTKSIENESVNDKLTIKDKVFLLSKDEAEKYLSCDYDRRKQGTNYAKNNGLYVNNVNGLWLLRTPSIVSSNRVFYVSEYGDIDDYDNYVGDTDTGIAPAIVIKKI